jgi:hypothetical protein
VNELDATCKEHDRQYYYSGGDTTKLTRADEEFFQKNFLNGPDPRRTLYAVAVKYGNKALRNMSYLIDGPNGPIATYLNAPQEKQPTLRESLEAQHNAKVMEDTEKTDAEKANSKVVQKERTTPTVVNSGNDLSKQTEYHPYCDLPAEATVYEPNGKIKGSAYSNSKHLLELEHQAIASNRSKFTTRDIHGKKVYIFSKDNTRKRRRRKRVHPT